MEQVLLNKQHIGRLLFNGLERELESKYGDDTKPEQPRSIHYACFCAHVHVHAHTNKLGLRHGYAPDISNKYSPIANSTCCVQESMPKLPDHVHSHNNLGATIGCSQKLKLSRLLLGVVPAKVPRNPGFGHLCGVPCHSAIRDADAIHSTRWQSHHLYRHQPGRPTATETDYSGNGGDVLLITTLITRTDEHGIQTGVALATIPATSTLQTLTDSQGHPTATVTNIPVFPHMPGSKSADIILANKTANYFLVYFFPILLTALLLIPIQAVNA
ncbi:hypothetical protein B0H66DRAFT_640824 [Apodospora peruviana]|uniref:Uncharacterized protein n=1 Tax=Apodospora peruviana TaxID=516989 RepID=A0AAE0M2U8_9PEZI|nr:hypothetical protein B0H66DRAFT_640824 [Apodospora peruviana]